LVERFEENAALRHPVFKPVDLPDFQIGDDKGLIVTRHTVERSLGRTLQPS
jgi:hypothetical protein